MRASELDVLGRMVGIGREVKKRIKAEVGEWLTVSIGIAPNRYLAKVASGLHKPDGLDVITEENIREVLAQLPLEELCGIKSGYAGRLRTWGIKSSLDFYEATPQQLKLAFHSIFGYWWWQRLHGWETTADDMDEEHQKSFGQSYALYKPFLPSEPELWQILYQLTAKMARRLREDQYTARGVHLSCLLSDYSFWHRSEKESLPLFADSDFYREFRRLLERAPVRPVRLLAVSCFSLEQDLYRQTTLLAEDLKKQYLTQAVDRVSDRWGDLTVFPGRMLAMERRVLDRIAFGSVRGLGRVPTGNLP